jgi:hypothetical protein
LIQAQRHPVANPPESPPLRDLCEALIADWHRQSLEMAMYRISRGLL